MRDRSSIRMGGSLRAVLARLTLTLALAVALLLTPSGGSSLSPILGVGSARAGSAEMLTKCLGSLGTVISDGAELAEAIGNPEFVECAGQAASGDPLVIASMAMVTAFWLTDTSMFSSPETCKTQLQNGLLQLVAEGVEMLLDLGGGFLRGVLEAMMGDTITEKVAAVGAGGATQDERDLLVAALGPLMHYLNCGCQTAGVAALGKHAAEDVGDAFGACGDILSDPIAFIEGVLDDPMGSLKAVGKVTCDYVAKSGLDVCGIGGAIYDEIGKAVHAVGAAIAGAAEAVYCFFADCSPPPDPPPPPPCSTDPNHPDTAGTYCTCPAGTGMAYFTKTVNAGYGQGSDCKNGICTNTVDLEYCRPCSKTEALIDGQCKSCPAYMNKSADGTKCELIQCPAGQRFTADKHHCYACPAGTHYSADGYKCDQDPIDCTGTGKQAMQTNAPMGAAYDAVSKSLGAPYLGKGWMCGCPEGTWFDGKQCREKPWCDPAKHLEFNETTGTCRPTVDCAAGEIIVTEQKGEFFSDVCKKCADGEVAVNGVCTAKCGDGEARGAMLYGGTSVPVCVPCPGGTAAGGSPDAYGEATACRSQCDIGTQFNPYSVSYDALQGLSLGTPGAGLQGGVGNFSTPGPGAFGGGNAASGPEDKAVKGGVCEVCPAGTKAVFGTASIAGVDISMATCVPCPDGETSSAGSTSCHHVFKWKPKGTKVDEGRGRGRDDGDGKRRRDDGDKPARKTEDRPRKTEERGGRREETPIRVEREPRPTRSESAAPAGCGAGRVMSSSGRCVIDLEGGGGGGFGGGGSRAPSGGGSGGARSFGGGTYYNPKP